MGDRLHATKTWTENRGVAVPLLGGARFPSNNVAWAEAYLLTKWHLDPSSRLATTDMGRKLGVLFPLWDERWI